MRGLWQCLAVVGALGPAPALPTPIAKQPVLAWELVSASTPRVVFVNTFTETRLVLRNVGDVAWSEAAGDHLAYHWLDGGGRLVALDGQRTSFPAPVPPGATVELRARLKGPGAGGSWIVEWEMVRENVRWYGPPRGSPPVRKPVLVVWRCGILQLAFAIVTLAGGVSLRLWRSPSALRSFLVDVGPVAWTWSAV